VKIREALHTTGGARPRSAVAVLRPASRTLPRQELVNLYQIAERMLDGPAIRVFELISATPGEGTSTLACELARTVMETVGRRVLLLKIVRQRAAAGPCLDSVLCGDVPLEAALTRVAGGSYLTAEIEAAEQPGTRLFDAQRFDDLFGQLSSLVEVVIVDAPPALTEFAGLVLASRVGGVILVVEAERTQAPIVNRARRLIENNGGRILGVVLNKQRWHIPRFFERWL
jgi:protein-tyrosine kinase